MTFMNQMFFFMAYSMTLGAALAMDAFSVSIADAMRESNMRKRRMCAIAGVYAAFQFVMPLTGFLCVHTIITIFSAFQKLIPWIALLLLGYIGGKMLFEALSGKVEEDSAGKKRTLFLQGIATSIDALSVGFTIADYSIKKALAASAIIALVTFAICITGLLIGKKAGETLSGRATAVGGIILIAIGIEIFIRGVFF